MCFNLMNVKIEEQRLSKNKKIEEPRIHLPNDIIIEILLKLPVRFLLQLMCVSESWKRLISDLHFAKNHLCNSTMNHQHQRLFSSIEDSHSYKIVSFPINPLFENPSNPIKIDSITKSRNYDIIGSCDGLFCLYNHHHKHVKLWNPCTRFESKRSPMIFLSYRPLDFEFCGFGHDRVNDKYKALLVWHSFEGGYFSKIVTKVYNFGTNSLKTINNYPLNRLRCIRRKCSRSTAIGTHVMSSLNWIAKPNRDEKHPVILSFDLEKETYEEVLQPKHDGYKYDPVLGVLRNRLCVCFHTKETEGVVWLMKENEVVESWTKLILVIPHSKCWLRISWTPAAVPLCISKNSDVLKSKLDIEPVRLLGPGSTV